MLKKVEPGFTQNTLAYNSYKMDNNINSDDLQEIMDLGVPHVEAVKALKLYKTKALAIENLFSSPVKSIATKLSSDDYALAVQNSLKEIDLGYSFYDTHNPESMLRERNHPVGLKNIGNTCYFNSLMQTYFTIPKFIKEILTFDTNVHRGPNSANVKKRSAKLIEELQFLFSAMILTNKRFLDPSKVLDALVDDSGNSIIIGEQKDVGEFNMNLIARIEEGLQTGDSEAAHMGFPVNGKVSQLFYAKQQEIVMAKEPDGQALVFENTAIFGQLNLDVNEKELYRAWDHAYHTLIEEYVTPKGHKTFAIQEIWPEKLPGILLFQIQRVRYDSNFLKNIKINSPFTFPQILYGDRFLLKNKSIYLKMREKLLRIKSEISRLEKELFSLENFENSGIDIREVLMQVSAFLDTQKYSIIDSKKKRIDPNILDASESDVESTQNIVDYCGNCVEKYSEGLKRQILDLELELERLYNVPELKAYDYHLHSILVHEGGAESGHYYAYIHDSAQHIWRKYSDTMIKDVDFAEVMKNSIGGSGDSSAYCLIYIHTSFLEDSGPGPELKSSNILEKYSSYIPNHVRERLLRSNSDFFSEIEEFKSDIVAENIKKVYYGRFSQLVNWGSEQNSDKKIELINFPMFLRSNQYESISRWMLLEQCMIEITGVSIEQARDDPAMGKSLRNKLCTSSFGPKYMNLSDFEKKTLEENKARFLSKSLHAKLATFVMQQLTKEDYLTAFKGIMCQIEKINDFKNEYQIVSIDSRKILAFRLTSLINELISKKNIEEALVWVRHLAFVITSIDNENSSIIKQVKSRLQHSFKLIKKKFASFYTKELQLELGNIIKNIENSVLSPSFDLSVDNEELSRILNEEPASFEWTTHNIAWDFYKTQKLFQSSFFYTWLDLTKKTIEKRGISEKEFKTMEKKMGF